MDALIISNFLLWGVLLCLVLVILACRARSACCMNASRRWAR